MEASPPPAVQEVVPCNDGRDGSTPQPSATTPSSKEASPGEDFKALRKHLAYKAMDMGELVASHGLSSALLAMDKAEVNPIVQDGEFHSLSIACTVWSRS
jgi:hypothetical protein